MSTPSPLTVHLIDDDEGVREALTILLAEAGYAVRSHKSGTDFLAVLDSAGPGCIVSDIRMPGIDGLELQQKLREVNCPLPLIFITGHGDIQMAVQAMRAGAVDFIEKPFDDQVLIDAIASAFKSIEVKQPTAATSEVNHRIESLTPREKEVLERLVIGKLNKTTAFELGLSVRTVEVHRARIMQKMQARSLSELVRMVLTVQTAVPR